MRQYFFVVLMIGCILISGCLGTPAEVSQDTKEVLKNASQYLPQDTIVQPTFGPLTTSDEYKRVKTTTPVLVNVVNNDDPIIGQWTLAGQTGYSCYVSAFSDGTGRADCNSFLIPVASRPLHWVNIGESDRQSFISNYNVTDDNTDTYYPAQYSEITGRLYSSMLPANTYLVKET